MSTHTKEDLLLFLSEAFWPKPIELIDELNKDFEFTLKMWKRRTEPQWKDLYGIMGIDIYNYLESFGNLFGKSSIDVKSLVPIPPLTDMYPPFTAPEGWLHKVVTEIKKILCYGER